MSVVGPYASIFFMIKEESINSILKKIALNDSVSVYMFNNNELVAGLNTDDSVNSTHRCSFKGI